MPPPGVDQAMWEQFLAFQEFQAASNAKQATAGSNHKLNARDSTAGQPLDSTHAEEEEYTDTRPARDSRPATSRSLTHVETPETRPPTPHPTLPTSKTGKDTRQNFQVPKGRLATPSAEPGNNPEPPSEPPSPERTTTPRTFSRRDEPARRARSPTASPNVSPAPRSRSPTPPPSNRMHKRPRSPSPQPGPSKRHGASSTKTKKLPPHPYDTCPTSYKKMDKKRGVRYMIEGDGKQEIRRTPVERLMTRKAKYQYVREHGHLFGDKHGCYFNPYSLSQVNEANCKRIEKPSGFQVGRGGPDTKPIHELIGLRDDYDYRLDIAKSIRKALVLYRPRKLTLKPGQNLTYRYYGSASRTNIYNYMLDHYRFLFHFRDESGENNWAIDAFCISSLSSNNSYAKATNDKASIYLKRNESGPRGQGGVDDDAEDDPRESSEGYEDDYALNARANRDASSVAPSSRSMTSNQRSRTSEHSKARRGYDDDPRPRKKQRQDSEERSSSPVSLPPEPTPADFRRANKVVAREDARDKALGASRDKVGAKPAAPPKGKEKPKEREGATRSKRDHVEVDDDDSDDEPIPLVSKKVTRRTSRTLSDSESTTARRPNKNAPKNTGKKAKEPVKGPAKSAKRKDPSPPPEESEPEEPRKPVKRPKMKAAPKPREEQLEEEPEQPDEHESPQPGNTRKRLAPKQPPPPQEEDDELPPLPPSLIPPSNPKATTTLHRPQPDKLDVGSSQAGSSIQVDQDRAVNQSSTQQLVKSGRAKAVGTIKIKAPIPPSDRSLRDRRR